VDEWFLKSAHSAGIFQHSIVVVVVMIMSARLALIGK
jgi:hypothetical protein